MTPSTNLPSPPIVLPLLPEDDNQGIHVNVKHEQSNTNNRDMDWTSLVDTATKATHVVANDSDLQFLEKSKEGTTNYAKEDCYQDGGTEHNAQFATPLTHPNHDMADLEYEVEALRQENQRLQEESQSATQQLKKFTEWFLQNVPPEDEKSNVGPSPEN